MTTVSATSASPCVFRPPTAYIAASRMPRDSASYISDDGTFTPVAPTKVAKRSQSEPPARSFRSEEHTSELQSLMRNSYAVVRLTTKQYTINIHIQNYIPYIKESLHKLANKYIY